MKNTNTLLLIILVIVIALIVYRMCTSEYYYAPPDERANDFYTYSTVQGGGVKGTASSFKSTNLSKETCMKNPKYPSSQGWWALDAGCQDSIKWQNAYGCNTFWCNYIRKVPETPVVKKCWADFLCNTATEKCVGDSTQINAQGFPEIKNGKCVKK